LDQFDHCILALAAIFGGTIGAGSLLVYAELGIGRPADKRASHALPRLTLGAAWEADLAKYDERSVIIPAPLQGYLGEERFDDEHRGPAVSKAYSLSRCWIDLAEHSRNWPTPASIPDHLKAIAEKRPADERDSWLKDAANRGEVDRLLSYALRSGELPLWVAPKDGPEKPVPPESVLEMDHATMVSGTYRPPNDRSWLYGRPLFVKWNDWVGFVSAVNAEKGLVGAPDPNTPTLPPETQFVSLSHALSWIAFGVSMSNDHLYKVMSLNLYGEQNPQEALKAAVAQLTSLARSEKIDLQGKYRESPRSEKRTLLTAPINPIKFADYRQFNYLGDELRHGEGLWHWREPNGTTVSGNRRGGRSDSFVQVSVNRADLLREFRPHGAFGWEPTATHWSDLEPAQLARAKELAREAEADEWWNWPQAAIWVGCRSLEHVATMRLCAEPWKGNGYDPAVALGAEHHLGMAYCPDPLGAVEDLQRAIERGEIRTLGRKTDDSPSHELKPLEWRGGKVVYNRTATLVSATNLLSEWACDIAVNRPDLWMVFPITGTAVDPKPDNPQARKGQPPIAETVFPSDRAPAVKSSRPPSDDAILAKADEMKARGLDGRTIAKEMRLEPGFENVATTLVRELIKRRWKPGGRPKKTA
jgi:hypothetical protein